MTTSTITAGDGAIGMVVSGAIGNDGGLVFQTGAAGAKVNALTISAAGNLSVFANAAPAFSVGSNVAQAITTSVFTKVTLQTKEFDTANAFDAITNYRFTPQVAGYYQVSGAVGFSNTGATILVTVYKNGSEFKRGAEATTAVNNGQVSNVSALINLNGSTDYLELYVYQNTGASAATVGDLSTTYFQAFLARSA
jgi:hypothetical protein